MNYDLPELPFIPGSLVSDNDDEKETQYQDLQDHYVASASSAFESEIERCEGLEALLTNEKDKMLLTDDDTIQSVKKAMENIEKIHLHYSRILRRQRSLSSVSKSAKRRVDLNKDIEKARNREMDVSKTLVLLKHKIFNLKNKRDLERYETEKQILQLRVQTGGVRHEGARAEPSATIKEKTNLKPEKISMADPACTLRKFQRNFRVYFKASNYQAADQESQATYLTLLIDQDLLNEMGYNPDQKHWVFPAQCAENGLPEEESIMSMLEVAWKRTHPIHTNRCELVNIVQREGESYAELCQRIDDTFKECEIEGLLTPEAFKGHIIYNALRNIKHKEEILRKTEVKVNIVKADCDAVCKIEEHIRYFAQASKSIFESGRLGAPVLPSNSVNGVNRVERRGSSSSSGGFRGPGRFSHLKGHEKYQAILNEKDTCRHCLKRHLGECNLQIQKIRCPICDKGCHTAEACCHVEGETSRTATRRGTKGKGQKRRYEERRFDSSPSKTQRSE